MRKLLILFMIMLYTNVNSQVPIIFDSGSGYTFNFDNSSEYSYFQLDTNKLWNIDDPPKNILALGTGNKALFTDTNIFYKEKIKESFQIKIFINETADALYLILRHKYDFENNKDGGIIEISHDNGDTWKNLLYDEKIMNNIFSITNFYSEDDTISSYDNQPGFTGSNTTTHVTEINFSVKGEERDTMLLRFLFSSDSVSSENEGWVIEEITMSAYRYDALKEFNNKDSDVLIYISKEDQDVIINSEETIKKLEVYTSMGKKVIDMNNCNLKDISLKLNTGLYFIQIYYEKNKRILRKVLI